MATWANSGLEEQVVSWINNDKSSEISEYPPVRQVAALTPVEHLMIHPSLLVRQPGYESIRGGFGTVRVFKLDDDELLAVKELRISGSPADRTRFAKRFARELTVWALLDHPNLLKLRGFFLSPQVDVAQFISPYQPSGHIGKYISLNNPGAKKRMALAEDTALGLQYLHNLSIIHGDIKELNVLVNSQRRAMLCDYGLSKLLDNGQPTGLTTTGVCFTFRYASPELLHDAPARLLPSDIWAWGCLFLKIVTDIIPYMNSSDLVCTFKIVDGTAPADVTSLNLNPSIQNMLVQCWNIDPLARPSISRCIEIIASDRQQLNGHLSHMYDVAFSPDGILLASASQDRTTRLWEVLGGAAVATLEHNSSVYSIAFSSSNTRIACGLYSGEIWIWEKTLPSSKTPFGSLAVWVNIITMTTGASVWSVAFFPDGVRLVAGLSNGEVKIWNGVAGSQLLVMGRHEGCVYEVAFSPEQHWIASCSQDTTIRIWDATIAVAISSATHPQQTLTATLEGHTDEVNSIAFSPDRRCLASSSDDRTIRVWSVSSWTHISTIQTGGKVRSLAFSLDGSKLAGGVERFTSNVQLWDTGSWTPLMTLEGHTSLVTSVAFSPDGGRLASGSYNKTVRIWRWESWIVDDTPEANPLQ